MIRPTQAQIEQRAHLLWERLELVRPCHIPSTQKHVIAEALRDERRLVWKEAIERLDAWVLSSEDEEHDNTIPTPEGDGTSHNKALGYLRKVYVGLLNECRQQAEEEGT